MGKSPQIEPRIVARGRFRLLPLRRRLMGQEELLPMAFCQLAGGHRQQRLVEVAGDFIAAGVNMRPAHHHQILRVDVITLKQRKAIFDNPAGRAAPACVHAADIAPIARRHQQRQTVGGHHAHLLPADGGKHRIGVGALRLRRPILMYDIAVNQFNRRHFAIGKGGGFMNVEKGVADTGDIAQ